MHPSVSVIMPVYNCEKHLTQALKRVLQQSLENIEVICVNDGSTDSSLHILEEFAHQDARIKLFTQENQGASTARNNAINQAKGEFITFLDSDDWYGSNTYLSTLYHGAKDNDVLVSGASFCNFRTSDDIESDFTESPYFAGYTFAHNELIQYDDYQFDYGFHRFLFHRSLFEEGENRFPSLSYFEDPVFLVRILSQARTLYGSSEVQYFYRCKLKPKSWTTKKALDLMEGVSQNLRFSKEAGLSRLHWYTIHHFDNEIGDMGIGVNPHVDEEMINERLAEIENLLDNNLLMQIDEADNDYRCDLRKMFEYAAERSVFRTLGARFLYWKRRL